MRARIIFLIKFGDQHGDHFEHQCRRLAELVLRVPQDYLSLILPGSDVVVRPLYPPVHAAMHYLILVGSDVVLATTQQLESAHGASYIYGNFLRVLPFALDACKCSTTST